MSVENIILKKFIIKKCELDVILFEKEFVHNIDLEGYDDDDNVILEENVAFDLGLINHEELNEIIDHNSRTTLKGLKKYHWKELINAESDKGYWDIIFRGKEDIEFSKFDDNDKTSSIIITEEEFVDLIDLLKNIA